MKVTTDDGKTFRLVYETSADLQLVNTLDHNGYMLLGRAIRGPVNPDGSWPAIGFELTTDPSDPTVQAVHAGRVALSALGSLFSIGLREAAINPCVHADRVPPADAFAQIKDALHALGLCIVQKEVAIKERMHVTGFTGFEVTAGTGAGAAAQGGGAA